MPGGNDRIRSQSTNPLTPLISAGVGPDPGTADFNQADGGSPIGHMDPNRRRLPVGVFDPRSVAHLPSGGANHRSGWNQFHDVHQLCDQQVKNVAGNDYIFGFTLLRIRPRNQIFTGDSFYSALIRLGSGKPDTLSLSQNDGAYGALIPTTVAAEDVFGNSWAGRSIRWNRRVHADRHRHVHISGLTLETTLTDGTNTKTVTSTPISTPQNRRYFGLHRLGFGSGGTVSYRQLRAVYRPDARTSQPERSWRRRGGPAVASPEVGANAIRIVRTLESVAVSAGRGHRGPGRCVINRSRNEVSPFVELSRSAGKRKLSGV